MSKIVGFACIGAAILLAACADQPNKPPKLISSVTSQYWTQQDQATNVQDWNRIAGNIADEMQNRGMLPNFPGSLSKIGHTTTFTDGQFYVSSGQKSAFIVELVAALNSEILKRNGRVAASPIGANVIDLGVDVIPWGSRLKSEPYQRRTEAVWKASLISQGHMLMSLQKPFYIFASDIPLYVDLSHQSNQLVNAARPLRYAQ